MVTKDVEEPGILGTDVSLSSILLAAWR